MKKAFEFLDDATQTTIYITNYMSFCETTAKIHNELELAFDKYLPNAKYISGPKKIKSYGISKRKSCGYFMTGLVPILTRYLKKTLGINPIIKDQRVKPKPCFNKRSKLKGLDKLRPSQEESLQACEKYSRGLIEAPTGFGKTECFIAIVNEKAVPSMVLVFSTSLLNQTRTRMAERLDIPEDEIGLVGDGICYLPQGVNTPIIIAMVPTLFKQVVPPKVRRFASRKQQEKQQQALDDFDQNEILEQAMKSRELVIVDEVHHFHSAMGEYKRLMEFFPKAYYRYGFSALPYNDVTSRKCNFTNANQLQLTGLFGDTLYSMLYMEAVDDGILIPPKVFCVDYTKHYTSHIEERPYEWAEEYKEFIVDNPYRNSVIAGLVKQIYDKKQCKRVILFVERVAHMENLIALFESVNMPIEVVYGGTKTDDRLDIFDSLRDSTDDDCKVVITNRAMREGVDISSIDCLVLAQGYKAKQMLLQSIGRGSRKDGVKTQVMVIDFIDTYYAARTVSKHSTQRIQFYKAMKYPTARLDINDRVLGYLEMFE